MLGTIDFAADFVAGDIHILLGGDGVTLGSILLLLVLRGGSFGEEAGLGSTSYTSSYALEGFQWAWEGEKPELGALSALALPMTDAPGPAGDISSLGEKGGKADPAGEDVADGLFVNEKRVGLAAAVVSTTPTGRFVT